MEEIYNFIIIFLILLFIIILLIFTKKYNIESITIIKKEKEKDEQMRKLEILMDNEETKRLKVERKKIDKYNKTSPMNILDNNILARFNLI